MTVKIFAALLAAALLATAAGFAAADAAAPPRAPYLEQTPPGTTPELFAPGIVSNGLFNRDCIVNEAGTEIYVGLMHGRLVTLLWSRLIDGAWTPLEIVPFARGADFAVLEPALSPDEQTLYFLTNKAAPGQQPRPGWGNQNIFAVDRAGDGWGEPHPAPAPITTDDTEYYPSFTRDGTLYFTHHKRGEQPAIHRSRFVDGAFAEPERLPDEVNCGASCYNATIAYDESFIITCVNGRDDQIGNADYYIVFRDADDTWSEPVNMGEPFNLPGTTASSAFVTRDGKYLFFSSDRTEDARAFPDGVMTLDALRRLDVGPTNGLSDIYWVDARVLEALRPSAE